MGMCCEKMMMIGWRNAWSMKLRVQDQGEDQRGPGKEVVREDCQAHKLNKEDAVDRCKWRKVIKEVRWPGWVWAGECFFWYRPTRVVPYKPLLNGCCCCCSLKLVLTNNRWTSDCLRCFDTVGWAPERASGSWTLCNESLSLLSVWSRVQIVCIWCAQCHFHHKTRSFVA